MSGNERWPGASIDCVIWPASGLGMAPISLRPLYGGISLVEWGQRLPPTDAYDAKRRGIVAPWVTAAVLDWLDPHVFD